MKKHAIFHPEAEREFLASVVYYAEKASGLGERFYEEIRRVVSEIESAPRRHGVWRHGTRRRRARHFPYIVVLRKDLTDCSSSPLPTVSDTPIIGANVWAESHGSAGNPAAGLANQR